MTTQSPYRRNVQELEAHATKFWSTEITREAASASPIPLLLSTLDHFLAILSVPVSNVEKVMSVLENSTMSANVFVKHLMVLADFGGEPFKRTSSNFEQLFPSNSFEYIWGEGKYTYTFQAAPDKRLDNSTLKVEGKELGKETKLTSVMRDAIAILLAGGLSTDEEIADHFAVCEIGNYVGKPKELKDFIRQRYIWVSRITQGAVSNSRGQILQKIVIAQLKDLLGKGYELKSNGTIPNVKHTQENDTRLTKFDVVVHHKSSKKYVAIEVSFQETTNSVIERKSGQAQQRYESLHKQGYQIAYVIDGAGNLERKSALHTICDYSDCTVGFSLSEMGRLANFIKDYVDGKL